MQDSLLRTDKEIAEIYARHSKTVYRVCLAYMKNRADAEDLVQDAFVQMIRKGPKFDDQEHEKAWLIRTASNLCKNALHHWWRKREDIAEHQDLPIMQEIKMDDVLEAILALPERLKTVVYMYYYEGYSSVEIARSLNKSQSTVRNALHDARTILRERLGEDFLEE